VRQVQQPVIIGAGWSGLACAVQLVRQGFKPVILDAAPNPGGRARAVDHELGGQRARLDNGQHLLLGAYRDTLEVMRQVGVAPAGAFVQTAFAVSYPDGWRLRAARAPAPWHLALGLVGARKMRLAERWALARWSRRQQRRHWHLAVDLPAAAVLADQPAALVRRLWRPLCLAALNVELEQASARIFLNVLRDSLGADEPASRLLQPRTDLSALFPEAAVRWLLANGADVRLHCPAMAVHPVPGPQCCRVRLRDGTTLAGPAVLALPPDRAAALLQDEQPALRSTVATLRALRFAPICTVYLRYAPATRLAQPFYALLDDAPRERYGQWVFDRGAFDPALDGILSVIVSGAGPHLALSREALGQRVASQLGAELGLPLPREHFTIIEKHATLVPAPDLQRPAVELPVPGLFLAGDSADSPYPSTIEGSVRSGVRAAQALAQGQAQMPLPLAR